MATFEVPDDLGEFMQELAEKRGKRPDAFVAEILDNYRNSQRNFPKTLAPKGYGLRPKKKKSSPP